MGKFGRQCCHKYYDSRFTPEISYSAHIESFSPHSCSHKSNEHPICSPIYPRLVTEGSSKGNIMSSTSIFLKNVYSSKKVREETSNYRPVYPEPINLRSKIQNGNPSENCKMSNSGVMGYFYRSPRCLSPRPTGLGIPQILRIQTREQGIRFSNASLRPFSGSLGLYPGDETNQKAFTDSKHKVFFLPRRLDNFSRDKRIVIKTWSNSNKLARSSGFQDKLGKIRADPSSKISVFRCYSGSKKYGAFPSQRQGFKNSRNLSGSPTLLRCFSKKTRKI